MKRVDLRLWLHTHVIVMKVLRLFPPYDLSPEPELFRQMSGVKTILTDELSQADRL